MTGTRRLSGRWLSGEPRFRRLFVWAAPMLSVAVLGSPPSVAFGASTTTPSVKELQRERAHVRVKGRHASCAGARTGSAKRMCALLQPFSEALPGGLTLSVVPRSIFAFFFRQQGVSIQINPETHWWCLWLCSSTTNVQKISASIALGGANVAHAADHCTNCGSLNVMGPGYWGINFPKAYEKVAWSGTIRANSVTYSFSGTGLY
jgi:hypothetical protein